MGWFTTLVDTLFNPIFGWLLNIPPILAIIFLSVLLGLLSTILQKYMTDQAKLKRLKDDTKKLQKQMQEARKQGEMAKMQKLQQKLMPLQMSMMKESFRPLFVTMLPFLLIFFWLSSHFAFYPIVPDEPFSVTATFGKGVAGEATLTAPDVLTVDEEGKEIIDGAATWMISGPVGEYTLTLTYAGAEFTRRVLITNDREYIQPAMKMKGSVTSFNVGNKKLLPMGDGFTLFGWHPGWIFFYIVFSIPVSLGLKKLLRVV